jgi:beta-lactam-binding protein with PASTA domain
VGARGVLPTALALLLLAGCGGEGESRAAPDVRGARLDVAEQRLEDAGLAYERIGGGAFGIVVRANWRVCDQEPGPGRPTTRVRLVVARRCPPPPQPAFFVPHLVGETLADARRRLDRRELPYRVVGPRDGTSRVCRQSPPAGRYAPEVVLHVAADCVSPPPPRPPLVPGVEGLDLAEAEELLAALGVSIHVEPPGNAGHHDVCLQDPLGGRRSWSVTLHVALRC